MEQVAGLLDSLTYLYASSGQHHEALEQGIKAMSLRERTRYHTSARHGEQTQLVTAIRKRIHPLIEPADTSHCRSRVLKNLVVGGRQSAGQEKGISEGGSGWCKAEEDRFVSPNHGTI